MRVFLMGDAMHQNFHYNMKHAESYLEDSGYSVILQAEYENPSDLKLTKSQILKHNLQCILDADVVLGIGQIEWTQLGRMVGPLTSNLEMELIRIESVVANSFELKKIIERAIALNQR